MTEVDPFEGCEVIDPKVVMRFLRQQRDREIDVMIRRLKDDAELQKFIRQCQLKFKRYAKRRANTTSPDLADAIREWIGQTTGKTFITMAQLEKIYIRLVVENTDMLMEAAKVLEIDESTLYRRLRRYGVPVKKGARR